jgi:signal transduction histidine kinase/ActR/RegA family two-component response regulator
MGETTENNYLENRVLVLMPTGRDANLICATLGKAGIEAEPCAATEDLIVQINMGAGAILLAEEALKGGTLERLSENFDAQPVWSDLPVVLFAGNAQNAEILSATVGTRFNATIVERPIRIPMLISAVRGALRARDRQYQSRNLLNQLEESDRQKDLFLATLSHELRTPLNSILGWLQLLNSDDSQNRIDAKHALAVIERNARAQSEMISDILFVSRIITGKLKLNTQPLDIIPVAQAAIEILRPSLAAKDINLHTFFDENAPLISGDADRLQQVFWNLLSNAIKFTPPNGTIEVRIEREKSNVKIVVSDSGQGISTAFLPYVFERFRQADSSYTRQVGGLGLGLAIVRHLVELHDGAVIVESAGENRGAKFTVSLPTAFDYKTEPEVEIMEKPLTKSAEPSGSIRVLLVEDDEDSREMLRIMFEQNGIQITDVESAAEAVEVIQQLKPDVLISDIGLPHEDGYELIGKIRQLSSEQGGLTPAIALTGYVSLQDRSHAFNVGFQEHLPKPVDIDKLLELVKGLVGNKLES